VLLTDSLSWSHDRRAASHYASAAPAVRREPGPRRVWSASVTMFARRAGAM